ncbi:MAG: helix-turn-helix transcriptional regulator [Clostridia bacterium]|nr:helix-turn-helix transcriptional regulator [Clostridia bacterium]
MERKSIGSFIAVLRKANGLTQRELADKLGISDKAVSRWERDETAPDLSLIPAIAEIFGVTSDELLRGERAGEKSAFPEKQAEKTEKQIKALLKKVRTKFFTKSLICILISLVGLFSAMICNCAFYKKDLGFIVALIFLATSLVLGIIFTYLSYASIDDAEQESRELAATRRYIIKKAFLIICFNVCVLAFCLPLAIFDLQLVIDIHNVFIRTEYWIFYGTLCVLFALLLCFFANIIVDRVAQEKGIYSTDESILQARKKNFRVFARPALSLGKIFVPVILVTIIAHIICLSTFTVEFFLKDKGTQWHSIESFVEYMETTTTDEYPAYAYNTRYLYNNYGELVCSYKPCNQSVYDIKTSNTPDNLPIITYSHEEYWDARDLAVGINACFVIAYIIEGVTLVTLYTVKTVKAYRKEKEE